MIDNKGSFAVRTCRSSAGFTFCNCTKYFWFLLPNVCPFSLFPLNYHHALSLEKKFLDFTFSGSCRSYSILEHYINKMKIWKTHSFYRLASLPVTSKEKPRQSQRHFFFTFWIILQCHALKKWNRHSRRRDLNSWPLVYETSALTTELRRPVILPLNNSDDLECRPRN